MSNGSWKIYYTLTFLRILEKYSGEILIDGIDISKIDLRSLRSKLTMIPQDIYLFEGTVRENLDSNNEFTDEYIWECLDSVNLKETFLQRKVLLSEINYYESNMSCGERQLIALCRAFLEKNKIILIDEATANIDLTTEKKIQECIKNTLQEFTVFTIAHRINAILHNDRILVLEKGEIAEFDTPENLLNDKSSKFYGLWQDSLAGIIY